MISRPHIAHRHQSQKRDYGSAHHTKQYSGHVPVLAMVKNLQGKLFGDKGYISEKLCQTLREKGIHLIAGIRRNMKNHLMPLLDNFLLQKQFIIEAI